MKKFKWLGLLLVFYTGSVFSQVPGSIVLFPEETTRIQKVIAQGGTNYYYAVTEVGTEIIGTETHIYRTYFIFNLSLIPDNATITQVEVNYSMSGTN